VAKSEVRLPEGSIRQTGEYDIKLQLHSEVVAEVKLIVAGEGAGE
jgi:large subunit ribosomal protein L9